MNREKTGRVYFGCAAIFSIFWIPVCCILWVWFVNFLDGTGDTFHSVQIPEVDFPGLQARYKPMADSLAAVTQDALLQEDYSSGSDISQTTSYKPTCAAGHVYRIYGTDRSFEEVLTDYWRFFSSRSEWNARVDNFFSAKTMSVRVSVLENATHPDAWEKYTVVYEVFFRYAEPDLGCVYITIQ